MLRILGAIHEGEAKQTYCHADRRGIAPLELVLSLPLMLALLVALVWLGFSVIHQAEVDIEARHVAWGKRFEPWAGRSFDFSQVDSLAEGSATKRVSITPMFEQVAGPEARHVVEQGSWDHRSLRFDKFPNLDLVAEMAIAAETGRWVEEVEELQQAIQNWQGVGEVALEEALRSIFEELTSPGDRLQTEGDASERRVELDRELERSRAEDNLAQLRQARDRIEKQLDDADDESDLKWLREQQLKRIDIEIERAKQRLDDL